MLINRNGDGGRTDPRFIRKGDPVKRRQSNCSMRPATALLMPRVLKERQQTRRRRRDHALLDRDQQPTGHGCYPPRVNLRAWSQTADARKTLDLWQRGKSHGCSEPLEPASAATTGGTAPMWKLGGGATRNIGWACSAACAASLQVEPRSSGLVHRTGRRPPTRAVRMPSPQPSGWSGVVAMGGRETTGRSNPQTSAPAAKPLRLRAQAVANPAGPQQ